MSIKITGMNSGLDTDSIVSELVKAYSSKKDNMVKKQTKLSWKQDAWAELNTKIKNLYTKTLSNLKFEYSYNKKSTTVSNSNIAKVVAGDAAVEGTQTLKVSQLAKAGYLTGGRLTKKADGSAIDVKGATTLSELGILADGENATIKVTVGGREKNVELSSDTSINGFLNSMKDAGIEASYDSTNKRIYMNVKKSGAAADFQMEGVGGNGLKVLSGLRLVTADDVSGLAGYDSMTPDEQQAYLDKEQAALLQAYQGKYDQTVNSLDALNSQLDDLNILSGTYEDAVNFYTDSGATMYYDADVATAMQGTEADRKDALTALKESQSWKDQYDAAKAAEADGTIKGPQKYFLKKYEAVDKLANHYSGIQAAKDNIADLTVKRDEYKSYVDNDGGKLTDAAKAELAVKVQTAKDTAQKLADTTDPDYETGAVRIKGQDAMIYLNGAQYTSNTNSFTVNNLTITAMEKTDPDQEVSINTTEDIDGVYDVIKNFITEYNSLIKEMDTLYNADAAKGYEPLTDEEKEALSDSEVDKWEKKIKDSVLRRDSSLNSVISVFKNSMMQSYTVNGKNYNLSSFGINTQSYFEAADNEKGVYHIAGNKDDSISGGEDDKLKTMLATNKDDVVGFFTKLAGDMYGKLQKESRSIKEQRTYNTFYDDKKLKSDYENYTKKIAEQEKKIAEMEDKYYAQFSAMEVALSKLNSQQSSLAGLLGG